MSQRESKPNLRADLGDERKSFANAVSPLGIELCIMNIDALDECFYKEYYSFGGEQGGGRVISGHFINVCEVEFRWCLDFG